MFLQGSELGPQNIGVQIGHDGSTQNRDQQVGSVLAVAGSRMPRYLHSGG